MENVVAHVHGLHDMNEMHPRTAITQSIVHYGGAKI